MCNSALGLQMHLRLNYLLELLFRMGWTGKDTELMICDHRRFAMLL